MEVQSLLSPRPSEIIILTEALDKYLGNQNMFEHFNLSMNSTGPQAEDSKLRRMENKMSISELRCLVFQLFDLFKSLNKMVKKELLNYENDLILLSHNFLGIIEKLKNPHPQYNKQLNVSNQILEKEIASRSHRIITLESECTVLKQNKLKLQKEMEELKLELDSHANQIGILKKQNYKAYEQNFSVSQKINELSQELQEENLLRGKEKEAHQKQVKSLLQSIESLQLIIRSKENSIESLENNMKKTRRNSEEREEQNVGKISSSDLHSIGSPLDRGFETQHISRNNRINQQHLQSSQKFQLKINERLNKGSREHYQTRPFSSSNNMLLTRRNSGTNTKNHVSSDNKIRSRTKGRMSFEHMEMELNNLRNQLSNDLKMVGKR